MKDGARKPYLVDLGIDTALGSGKTANLEGILSGRGAELSREEIGDASFSIARCASSRARSSSLAPEYAHRVNALLDAVASQVEEPVAEARRRYGRGRVAVLLGSTDNGSEESLAAARGLLSTGRFPAGYSLAEQSADLAPRFLARRLELSGPAMAVSTACASAATAIARARDLIACGLCDAAVAGGADIVSDSVALGFLALEAVSSERCQPFSRNRRGITLGEGAAIFLLCRDDLGGEGVRLLGIGEACDAHHLTAPDPEGEGASAAMSMALRDASLESAGIDYLNLHGTGTELNDAMESKAVARVFGAGGVPASSTKGAVGHTLGAAGAVELGFCWLALSSLNRRRLLPPQVWDGEADGSLPRLDLVGPGRTADRLRSCMSVSFAFGGVDAAAIIGREGGAS